jgi:putative hydrolase of the HAD superfamily
MRSLAQINTWIFDLDNTLYPASCRLFDQMHVKMGNYVMKRFGIEYAEAKRIQKELFYKYGTTLRGLMVEHGEHPDDFLEQVHDIDYSPVKEDKALRAAIAALPGRKLIFTNGTSQHAKRTTDRLGITDQFEAVYDIIDANYVPKPQLEPYQHFAKRYTIDTRRAAFFEDIAHNLKVPHDLGMRTVLVKDATNDDANHLNADTDASYVHFQTENLTGFLKHAITGQTS